MKTSSQLVLVAILGVAAMGMLPGQSSQAAAETKPVDTMKGTALTTAGCTLPS